MTFRTFLAKGALLIGAWMARADVPGDPLTGSGDVARTLLTYDELMNAADPNETIDDSAFALPANAAQPDHVFEGALRLIDGSKHGRSRVQEDPYHFANDRRKRHLPKFDFEFVQEGSHLIPRRRGLVRTDERVWEWIVLPGRVWRENGDNGLNRTAIPFAIVDHNANCVHNGMLMFLFDDNTVSNVRYQITQETCLDFKIDLWGQLAANYDRHAVDGADALRSGYEYEVRGQYPTAPIERLKQDFPQIDLSAFGAGISPQHMTLYGVVLNGVNYIGGGKTRTGQFADRMQMTVPSYSTAKAAFAGASAMWLKQTYGLDASAALVREYVEETKHALGDWSAVTIDHALNMATGNYASAIFMDDETGTVENKFELAEKHADKMTLAVSFPHNAAPGTTWVYHTTDTFIATRAMQKYLRTQQGDNADIFDAYAAEVLAPIGFTPDALTTKRTYERDGSRGEAWGGYGLFYTADAVAKLVTFLDDADGRVGNEQKLDPGMLAGAMQRDPTDRGIETSLPGYFHKLGFWATQIDAGSDCAFWVPFLSGYGGISIVMLPNGGAYYYFSDNNEFVWLPAVRELAKIVPPCDQRGDMNCDGRVTFDDIDGFVAALVGRETYESAYPRCHFRNADINRDLHVDFDDIDLFAARLANGKCN